MTSGHLQSLGSLLVCNGSEEILNNEANICSSSPHLTPRDTERKQKGTKEISRRFTAPTCFTHTRT